MPPWTAVETVPTSEAFARWVELREGFGTTGLWPLIVPVALVAEMKEGLADRHPVEAAREIEAGESMDAAGFFARRLEERREDDEDLDAALEFDPGALRPSPAPPVDLQTATLNDLADDFAPEGAVAILGVPCRAPWEVPTLLGFGGWNDCPMPVEIAAALRDWHARHGAEPLTLAFDTLELFVKPIQEPALAKRTAIEQYAFCTDIVDQGVGTIEALATSLLGSSVWFFWWD